MERPSSFNSNSRWCITSSARCRRVAPLATIFVALGAIVFAQSSPPTPSLRGSWAASAPGNQVFQGTWTAQPVPNDPHSAQGTWTLLNGTRIAAQGTWSATKSERAWSGTWQARVTETGRLFSGTWRTQTPVTDVKTLVDLFQHALDDQVTGTWGSGRLAGSWSVRAFK